MSCALLLALVLLGQDGGTASSSAQQLNADGYELKAAGRLDEAIDLFERSVEADPRLAVAHYNLAAAKAKQAYDRAVILDHLATSIRLDPGLRARAAVDPDFGVLARTVRFQQQVLGANLDSRAGLTRMLPQVQWHAGPQFSDMGPGWRLTFKRSGVAVFETRHEVDQEDGGLHVEWRRRQGRWQVIDRDREGRFGVQVDLPASAGQPRVRWRARFWTMRPDIGDAALIFESTPNPRTSMGEPPGETWLSDQEEPCC